MNALIIGCIWIVLCGYFMCFCVCGEQIEIGIVSALSAQCESRTATLSPVDFAAERNLKKYANYFYYGLVSDDVFLRTCFSGCPLHPLPLPLLLMVTLLLWDGLERRCKCDHLPPSIETLFFVPCDPSCLYCVSSLSVFNVPNRPLI